MLDENVYSVDIVENGKTYEIENEVGKGFANQAMKGNIKITKTSSDGKLDGFSFVVVGTDFTGKYFTNIYKTDEKGEIYIEGLRLGEYKVYELSDETNSRYILPEVQTIVIEHDKTTEVSFHNQLKEIPQTGDESNSLLWAILLAISGIGLTSLGIYNYKKSKKNNMK